MVSKKKITISWSGGKDSAFALHKILEADQFDVVGLHTVFNKENLRVGLHGVHEDLIERQAEAIGLPLTKLYLPVSGDHEEYKTLMRSFYEQAGAKGVKGVVFGDIFLEDLKAYRDNLLSEAGLEGIYPLWKQDTRKLLTDFLNAGFRTLICAANSKYFSKDDLGKTIDQCFVSSLNQEIDSCGENGEFHSFVYDGPIFTKKFEFGLGEVTSKTYNYLVTDASAGVHEATSEFLFQEIL
jgi:uncharacterized protein (TIGR00290 family)